MKLYKKDIGRVVEVDWEGNIQPAIYIEQKEKDIYSVLDIDDKRLHDATPRMVVSKHTNLIDVYKNLATLLTVSK